MKEGGEQREPGYRKRTHVKPWGPKAGAELLGERRWKLKTFIHLAQKAIKSLGSFSSKTCPDQNERETITEGSGLVTWTWGRLRQHPKLTEYC